MSQKDPESISILVVDDSSFLRKRVRTALEDSGYRLVEANSGFAALRELEKQDFACVLTDLVMPEMDGFGLLAEIKRREIKTPVVVLTADVQKTTHARCAELGAVGLIQKPMSPDELRSVLSKVLAQR